MTSKSDQLEDLYKQAKDKRLVITKEEFAKAIDTSRSTWHRLAKTNDPELVPLISKARALLAGTNNVLNEPYVPLVKTLPINLEKLAGSNAEQMIQLKASLIVLEQMMDLSVSLQTGKSIGIVSAERRQAVSMEAQRLFAEYAKKLQ